MICPIDTPKIIKRQSYEKYRQLHDQNSEHEPLKQKR